RSRAAARRHPFRRRAGTRRRHPGRQARSAFGVALARRRLLRPPGLPLLRARLLVIVRGRPPRRARRRRRRPDRRLRGVVNGDRDRLVETASRLVDVPSFTGDEEPAARVVVELYESLGLQVQWQQVEEGRANALGVWPGAGGGKSLMFNGHLDTSYSG